MRLTPRKPRTKTNETMLEIALAPAAITLGIFDHALRRLLVAALEVVHEPDLPVLTEHQGGFDKVVTEDMAAKRLAAGELGEVAVTP